MVSIANRLTREKEKHPTSELELLPAPIRWCAVPISQVLQNNARLDASAYDIDTIDAVGKVHNTPYGWIYLWGVNGLVSEAYYPRRYKRIYTSEENGEAFYLPSHLDEIKPQATKYISEKTVKLLEGDRIAPANLLLSRSGTIGKCTISSKTTIGKLFSDDVIRISFKGEYDLGYTYAFFKTEVGLKILQSNNYGAVIDHIEPEHLRNIPIPNVPEEVKRSIHEAVIASYDLRDQSNDLIDKAQRLLYEALCLPETLKLQPQYYGEAADLRSFSVRASELNNRLDASYHLPEAEFIIQLISQYAKEVTTLGDPRISKEIILPGRFKRVYVEKGKGVPFFGGKQLLQLDPSGEKYLALETHADRIEKELALSENMCAVTCSGTIGKVMIIPKHWQGWTMNQHVMRIVPASTMLAGYIYAWLSSNYASKLVLRYSYGAVIDEIEDAHLAEVPIPLLKDEAIQEHINSLVLQANDLRYEAYLKEQTALQQMDAVLTSRKQ